jgi:DHA2 family multidrug resistance protein
MPAPPSLGPFRMPMFRSFVPTAVRPWIYVLFALSFQLTGGVYLGALDEMIGARSLMREDILMCMYANLAGMAIYFPLLFRMKFRFTNKTLLLSASLVIALCNLSIPHIRALPLVWLLCFICGCAKIQGTFECMSNIQLWITPRPRFSVSSSPYSTSSYFAA